jgi:hypothetical protein
MIKPTQTTFLRRVAPAIAAAALLGGSTIAQAAVDPQITAARASASQADIEQASTIAYEAAQKIGNRTIRLTTENVRTLARGITTEIIAKGTGQESAPPNNVENKRDEIAEVAAFVLSGIASNPKFSKGRGVGFRTQKIFIVQILKSVLKEAINTAYIVGDVKVIRDVAGSVAQTIRNNAIFRKEEKLQAFLKGRDLIRSIVGQARSRAFKQGINEGFDSPATAVVKYEDGNVELLLVADPETDLRPA